MRLRPTAPSSLTACFRASSSSLGSGDRDRRWDRTSTDTYVAEAIPRAAARSCSKSRSSCRNLIYRPGLGVRRLEHGPRTAAAGASPWRARGFFESTNRSSLRISCRSHIDSVSRRSWVASLEAAGSDALRRMRLKYWPETLASRSSLVASHPWIVRRAPGVYSCAPSLAARSELSVRLRGLGEASVPVCVPVV